MRVNPAGQVWLVAKSGQGQIRKKTDDSAKKQCPSALYRLQGIAAREAEQHQQFVKSVQPEDLNSEPEINGT